MSKLTAVQISTPIVNASHGHYLVEYDWTGNGNAASVVGIAAPGYSPTNPIARGEECCYLDNGDGSGHNLRKLKEVVTIGDNCLYELGHRRPINHHNLDAALSLHKKNRIASTFKRLVAAGFTPEQAQAGAAAIVNTEIAESRHFPY